MEKFIGLNGLIYISILYFKGPVYEYIIWFGIALFSDIWKEDVEVVTENTQGMEEIFKAYELYKNQFIKDQNYPIAMSGKISSKYVVFPIICIRH